MSIKVTAWDDGLASKNIMKRFDDSSQQRRPFEQRWLRNEAAIYSTGNFIGLNYSDAAAYAGFPVLADGVDQSGADSNNVYVFKNLRFLHAQMSANPPSVVMRPTSSDQDDHRRADAADRVVRWAIRHYQMQEQFDQLTLQSLTYGSGFLKTVWDSTKGDIIEWNEADGSVKLEGDIAITVPFVWNVFVDPDARSWKDVKWVIERKYMDFEEACARWPEKEEELKAARVNNDQPQSKNADRQSYLANNRYNSVELLEYWETGLPTNGYLGRYCLTTSAGKVIEPCRPSPFRFKKAGTARKISDSGLPDDVIEKKLEKIPEQASLPYHPLTDIDVPNIVWGRSSVEYVATLQENLLRIDTAVMDNIYAHGVARMVVPDTAEVAQNLSNSPWDVVKISANQPPYFMEVPQLMPEMVSTRVNMIQGINDGMGVNDAMFGVQKRETSGTSMNYATNQGNMIRRRIFNKYVLSVESVYKSILSLIVKHWPVSKTISVIGKENALESVDLKGSDIDGGYDIIGEYGVSLSLDPMSRREEIMMLQPLFEKAGVPTRTSLKLMKLNELEGMYDRLSLAENRQREVFDEMIASGRYIPPEDLLDHENMISWALEYFMTSEFQFLEPELKELCKQHVRDRVQLAAAEKASLAGAPPPGATPGPAPSLAGEVAAPELGAPPPGPIPPMENA
jgi:hypothetical protein